MKIDEFAAKMNSRLAILKYWNNLVTEWSDFNIPLLSVKDLKVIGAIITNSHPNMIVGIFLSTGEMPYTKRMSDKNWVIHIF